MCVYCVSQYLRDQTDMLVVGVIGLQGTGKSTIMSLLSANSPEEDQRLVLQHHDSVFLTNLFALYSTSLLLGFTHWFSVKQGVCIQSSDAGDQGESWEPEQWNRFLHHSGEGHLSGHAGQTVESHRTVLFSEWRQLLDKIMLFVIFSQFWALLFWIISLTMTASFRPNTTSHTHMWRCRWVVEEHYMSCTILQIILYNNIKMYINNYYSMPCFNIINDVRLLQIIFYRLYVMYHAVICKYYLKKTWNSPFFFFPISNCLV